MSAVGIDPFYLDPYCTAMVTFKELDPAFVLKALEGHPDVLTAAAKERYGWYESFSCPRCLTKLIKEFDIRHTFADPDYPVSRALLRCHNCRYLIDPHSNVILEYGDASKIPVETIPIINPRNG